MDEGWSGVEALSGIPGSAGATPVQNVGAYGQEVAQTIARVRVWDRREERVRTMTSLDCRFTYRDSVFKGTDRYVVIDVMYQLIPGTMSQPVRYADLAAQLGVAVGERVPLGEAREAVLAQRRRRGMVLDAADHDTWSCGSFFTNPVLAARRLRGPGVAGGRGGSVATSRAPPRFAAAEGSVKTSAAWLIEKAGFAKGFGLPGPASLSTKHTLAVTNRGAATASDVAALAREVRDGVRDTFGVTLETSRCWWATRSEVRPLRWSWRAGRRARTAVMRRWGDAGCTAGRTSRARPCRLAGLGVPPPRRPLTDLLGDVVRREPSAAAPDPRDELGARPEGGVHRLGRGWIGGGGAGRFGVMGPAGSGGDGGAPGGGLVAWWGAGSGRGCAATPGAWFGDGGTGRAEGRVREGIDDVAELHRVGGGLEAETVPRVHPRCPA